MLYCFIALLFALILYAFSQVSSIDGNTHNVEGKVKRVEVKEREYRKCQTSYEGIAANLYVTEQWLFV